MLRVHRSHRDRAALGMGWCGPRPAAGIAIRASLRNLLLASLTVLWSDAALAYRPFDSTDASVVDVATIEIEFGPLAYLDARHGSTLYAPDLRFNFGLWRNWEAVLEGARLIERDRAAGELEMIEAAVSVKGLLREGTLQGADGMSIATEFGVLLPIRNEPTDYGMTAVLIGSRRVADWLVHLNAAATLNRDGNAEWFGGLIVEGDVESRVRPVLELTVEHDYGRETTVAGALVGAIFNRGHWSFDLGFRAAREDAWAYEGRMGFTRAFSWRNR